MTTLARKVVCGGIAAALAVCALVLLGRGRLPEEANPQPLHVLVADTSAVELDCSCAPGAPRRQYEPLRLALQSAIGRPVQFEYIADFLFDEMPEADARLIRSSELMIGKHSAINYAASKLNQPVRWIASLTRIDGSDKLVGIFVARVDGPIKKIGDLQGHKVSLGMPFHAEKHDAALAALRRENAGPAETRNALLCRDAVADVVAGRSDAAVISDYSQVLLQTPEVVRGVKLAVIGKTDEVPYIAVFSNDWVSQRDVDIIRRFLTEQTGKDRELLKALQSSKGFVPAQGVVVRETRDRRNGQ